MPTKLPSRSALRAGLRRLGTIWHSPSCKLPPEPLRILSFAETGRHSTAPSLPSTLSVSRTDFIALFPKTQQCYCVRCAPWLPPLRRLDPVAQPGRSIRGHASGAMVGRMPVGTSPPISRSRQAERRTAALSLVSRKYENGWNVKTARPFLGRLQCTLQANIVFRKRAIADPLA